MAKNQARNGPLERLMRFYTVTMGRLPTIVCDVADAPAPYVVRVHIGSETVHTGSGMNYAEAAGRIIEAITLRGVFVDEKAYDDSTEVDGDDEDQPVARAPYVNNTPAGNEAP